MDTTVQDPLLGRLLDGRYRVQSRIAKGGMASVYLAVDTRLDRTVAVKAMHAGLAADESFRSRFIREAKSAARLSHPNVVAVYDQGTDGDTVFLAMEHVEGRTLRDLLRQRRRLTPRQAIDVLEPVLAALGAAHRAGLVHRDVKPENVLLADDGRIKVADFGLARAVTASSSATATQGMLIGTVAYLSPEQVERGVADARSDVYAAGVLLFEMLTGSQPFDGESPIQVAYQHVHSDVPAPSSRVPGLPTELDDLVRRATSRDPDQRPADADRMLAELSAMHRALPDEALDAAPATADTLVVPLPGAPARGDVAPTAVVGQRVPDVGARPSGTSTTGPLPAPRRRRRGGLVALLLVLALAVAGGVAGWYLGAGPGAYTTTPGLLGLTEQAAQAKLEAQGLHSRTGTPVFSETVAAGKVVSTDPDPGSRVRKNGTVTLVLSKGKERYDVPELAGKPLDQAKAALTDLHLTTTVTQAYDEKVPSGTVIRTDPDPGTPLKRGAPVTLVVSKGRQPIPVTDWTGKRADQATADLQGKGLKVATRQDYSETVPAGSVISQSPTGGTLYRGDTVTLVVSQGPPLVQVPDVRDKKASEARRILEKAGFQVEQRGTRILDRVLGQSPGAGEKAPKGSVVTITTI
ncbi:MAG TPA: Stk1 family PASTA domain-containing Ser/Thr kinase [Motilibacteraceae bacterium]|nr:Stk1 family PASTA domain-containing Ser/Thr kinase [Motilibacteraceae bacterium]